MTGRDFAILINLVCLGGVLLICVPVLRFLVTGWEIRRDKLFSYLNNEEALNTYYSQFPYRVPKKRTQPVNADLFRQQFHYLYGRRHFAIPLGMLILICSVAAWGIALSLKSWFHVAGASFALPKIAVGALLGAFAWSVNDEFSRLRRRDLAPIDILGWNFRFLISVPFGFAFAAVLKEDFGLPLAFLLGAFPTQMLFTFARRIAAQKLGITDSQGDAVLELMQLQSIDRSNAERFADEGINTISTLAWADPIDLTIRTNFDLNYVLDCMSQALLWVYFQDKTKLLYQLSLRGAQEASGLVRALATVSFPVQASATLTKPEAQALATLEGAATVLGMTELALLTTLGQVADDPYTRFILQVWR